MSTLGLVHVVRGHLVDEGKTILVSTHYMDEAERCHQLAVLETGNLRKQGTPTGLMAELNQRVVEVSGPQLRRVKEQALQLPQVMSAAQQGLKLRVLLKPGLEADPAGILRETITGESLEFHVAQPSLEDVFVACTTRGQHA